ncbi:MAG TPA: diaminopimelate decarboxylase [Acidimicrobiales bacterium]|nr:diaminopimelate decarboxylase [Acidimicrobiales bacterium]
MVHREREQSELLGLFSTGASLEGDALVIAGRRVSALADEFATPALIIDEEALRSRARRYRDGLAKRWPNSQVVWASKSLPCTALYRLMAEEGLGADVAGGGELVMALRAGMDPSSLVLHGNAKTDEEIQMAVTAGVGTVVIDNFDDIDRLERTVRDEQGVLVRVLPMVEADTHEAIATGHANSKFGLSLDDARRAVSRLRASDHLRLDGLHVHVGSQILDTEPFARAAAALAPLGEFAVYDLGGGLGARYTYDDHPPSIEEYLDALVGAAREHLPASARILIEPGRSLVAETACTLYRVVSVKHGGARTFVAVDGGMGDNLEVSLYGQRFEATVAERVGGGATYTLVGRHCESGDQLIESVALDEPKVGDVIAVPVTGAYCLTMANNYNGALRPPIVMVREGVARVVLRRETYEDLVARDVS